MRRLVFLLALSSCGRKAPTPAPPTPVVQPRAPAPSRASASTLNDLLHDDLVADSAFPWSATRRLTWNDFRGQPPRGGAEVAKTAYTLFYGWRCRGDAFDFQVIAAFRPRQSWVQAIALRDTTLRRSALRHEQTHFDLAEVHVRRIRRYFGGLAGACRKTDSELTRLATELIDQEKVEQQRYDAETEHGQRSDEQSAWSAEVARRLGL